jgi:uncharacterized protein involved in exopolysaccharide biosynthesis
MEFSLSVFFRLIKKEIRLFLSIILVITGLTMAYAFISPKVFESVTTVLPPDESQGGGGLSSFLQNLSGGLSLGGGAQSNKTQLFTEILKSKNLSKYVIDSLKLKENPKFQNLFDEDLNAFISNLLDITPKKSGLISISVNLSSNYFSSQEDDKSTALLASNIANKSIEGLEYLSKTKSTSKAKKKRMFIEKILAEKGKVLDSIDKNLEQFRSEKKAFEIDEQAKAVLNNAVSIGSELAKAEIELKLKSMEYDGASNNLQFYANKVNKLKEQYQNAQRGGLSGKDDFSISLNDIPSLIRGYTNLMREQKIMEQLKLYLETQRYQEIIQEESDVPLIEVLDKATPAIRPIAPVKKLVLIVSLLISTLLSIVFVITRAYFKQDIYFKKV